MLHVMTPFGLFCKRSAPKAQLHRLAFNKKENQNAQFTKSHLDLCRLLAACISQSIHSILNVPLLIIPAPPYPSTSSQRHTPIRCGHSQTKATSQPLPDPDLHFFTAIHSLISHNVDKNQAVLPNQPIAIQPNPTPNPSTTNQTPSIANPHEYIHLTCHPPTYPPLRFVSFSLSVRPEPSTEKEERKSRKRRKPTYLTLS